jgi:Reverse transcriptase (RNA-dependent DNA polymerase)
MDFADFFPSITANDIVALVRENLDRLPDGWQDIDTSLFCSLACRSGALTIGAPTSPALANAVCYELDEKLTDLSKKKSTVYTRYADDLFFSTTEPNVLSGIAAEVPEIVKGLRYPKNLRINRAKTRNLSKRGRRAITGLIVTNDATLSIGRRAKRRLRSQVHNFSLLNETERDQLRGWLAYCKGVEPEFINRLNLKFGSERVLEARRRRSAH